MDRAIYINGRFLFQRPTGVNRYAYELCKALHSLGVAFKIICPKYGCYCDEYDLKEFHILRWGIGSSHFWEQCVLPLFFMGKKGSRKLLVNFTGIGPVLVCDKIITIHDLAFKFNPRWYSKKYSFFYNLMTPASAKTAMKILTVSIFSKNEIIRMLNIKEDKIEVVYNAVSSTFYEKKEMIQPSDEKYILAVSSIDPRKNFECLLKAFSYLEDLDIHLYIIGGKNRIYRASSVEQEMERNKQVHWIGRVSDDKLRQYYQQACCFVYPSLYEGFGIPPIEAMAMNCPVVAADIPVLHETCGKAALYADPYKEKDLAMKIKELLENEELQKKLREYGNKQIESYDWQKSALKLLSIIKSL